MRKIYRPLIAATLSPLLLISNACTASEAPPAPPVEHSYFPAAAVCSYPANVPVKTFKNLGGGTWARINPNDANSPFECVRSNPVVQLVNNTNGTIEVGYSTAGVEKGSSMITLTYALRATGPLANEPTYRNMFANLIELMSKQTLGAAPPDLFRKKLSNLASYSSPGKGFAENFDVGPGFVSLSREAAADRLSLDATVTFYPDIGLKLEK